MRDTASPEIIRQSSASFLGGPRLITLAGVNRRLEVIYERAAIILQRHKTQVHHFKSEAADPLHQPHEGTLIGQPGAKGRRARVVIAQSSNSAHSAVPAWPTKVISYVWHRIGIMP